MKKTILIFMLLVFNNFIFAQDAVKFTKFSNNGTAMIFLPHIGCSSEMWQEIANHYTSDYSVYLLDFAGFNNLQPIEENYTEKYVLAIEKFIKENRLKKAILVGQNYGAFVATKLSFNKKNKIKAVICSDFYPKLSMVLDKNMSDDKMKQIQNGIHQFYTKTPDSTFRTSQIQTAKMMNFTDEKHIESFVKWQINSDKKTLAGVLCEQISEDLIPELKTNKTPMLVFNTWIFAKAQNKPISESQKSMKEMFGNAPKITHKITEKAKDFIAIDQPKWFISEMDKFLKRDK